MKTNVGSFDRTIRVIAGVAILSLWIFLDGDARWFALIGLVPLATAATGLEPAKLNRYQNNRSVTVSADLRPDSTAGAAGVAAFSGRRTGGTRTLSPAASRVSALARPLLTRTSPDRMTR